MFIRDDAIKFNKIIDGEGEIIIRGSKCKLTINTDEQEIFERYCKM